ncbi:MAG: hypothetical protein QOI99_2451 [Actinomycetota bacterium]|jgi:prevent-host-death family protein|nr:hypothetical protein [Actinomycetota bacterium]
MLVNIHAAKTHFSELIQRAAAGEEIVIGRAGVPVAKLVPFDATPANVQKFGFWKDRITLHDDWDSDETNEEIARTFFGGDQQDAP